MSTFIAYLCIKNDITFTIYFCETDPTTQDHQCHWQCGFANSNSEKWNPDRSFECNQGQGTFSWVDSNLHGLYTISSKYGGGLRGLSFQPRTQCTLQYVNSCLAHTEWNPPMSNWKLFKHNHSSPWIKLRTLYRSAFFKWPVEFFIHFSTLASNFKVLPFLCWFKTCITRNINCVVIFLRFRWFPSRVTQLTLHLEDLFCLYASLYNFTMCFGTKCGLCCASWTRECDAKRLFRPDFKSPHHTHSRARLLNHWKTICLPLVLEAQHLSLTRSGTPRPSNGSTRFWAPMWILECVHDQVVLS